MKKYIDRYGNIYIRENYRSGEKVCTRTIEKLGKVKDIMIERNWTEEQVIEWVNQYVQSLNEQKKSSSAKAWISLSSNERLPMGTGPDSQGTLNIGYLFLQSVLSSLGLNDILTKLAEKSKVQFDLNAIISYLIFDRIIHPSSKYGAWNRKHTYLQDWDFELHQIYRALDLVGKNMDFIQQELFKSTTSSLDRNTEVLYYDCTNFFFETEQGDPDREIVDENGQLITVSGDRQYGHSKENRPSPIVQMGLFVDKNGIPIRFNIFPGNRNEQISIDRQTFNEIHRKYKIGSFVYSADAGLGSDKLKQALKSYAFPSYYVVSQSLKKMGEDLQRRCLDEPPKTSKNKTKDQEEFKPATWRYFSYDKNTGQYIEKTILMKEIDKSEKNDRVYFQEIWHKTKSGETERLIVTYQPLYAHYQKQLRNEQIARAEKKLEAGKQSKSSYDGIKYYDETHTTTDGEIATKNIYTLNEDKVSNDARFDGFYCISTNLDDDVDLRTILEVNKRRWQIEAAFRVMKTDLKARPVYVHNHERIKAHFLICFLALLTVRILEATIGNAFTTPELFKTLREMNITKLENDQ
ncbi:MAG: IS1634 family transposase, partial [Erysipelotrichaceae bacterium]|nr:IS1634 family transposase [Erysipelotrichaceae bacterium]